MDTTGQGVFRHTRPMGGESVRSSDREVSEVVHGGFLPDTAEGLRTHFVRISGARIQSVT